ncbi:HGL194Wp [Eremothecium sinecaudum]|uniref:non-specific serine/threonine protein kinase n=1 Tax=Eremothecium sinecaudum TaxID=45286 RepID=A0A0X8HV90_9SACH|nr:HGL194Wp [Eremothecium sinecaudum]AMD22146.1 HGL194Wp [Eremothecium sinecaudum]
MVSGSTIFAPQAQRPRKNTLSSKLGKLFGAGMAAKPSPTPKELQNSSPVNSSPTLSSQTSRSGSALSPVSSRPITPPVSPNRGGAESGRKPDYNSLGPSQSQSDSVHSGRPLSPAVTPATTAVPSSQKVSPVPQQTGAPQPSSCGRFVVHEDGTHQHVLKNAKRQEKLSSMIKNMLGAQKLRAEAKSAVPNILLGATVKANGKGSTNGSDDLPTLFSGLMKQFAAAQPTDRAGSESTASLKTSSDKADNGVNDKDRSKGETNKDILRFAEKYGRCQEVIGKGTFGVVRICQKKGSKGDGALYAVKEFKRRPSEDPAKYSRRLTSEFCISSSLKHINIIQTLDLFQDAKGDYCEVMEYCSGGDLFTLIIAAGRLEYMEADCFFKQLIRGVVYMHDMGVCHRDLKPENLILTSNGTLKITDFGNGECFRMAWEKDIHLSGGVCGSSPYIAPEEYTLEEFDPRPVDIWACGTIYMAMRTGRQLWRTAQKEDEFYAKYLKGRKDEAGYEPIEQLKRARCRNVIYSILDPVPSRRINGRQILNSEWGREIKCCVDSNHRLR